MFNQFDSQLMEAIPLGVCLIDSFGEINDFNQSLVQLTGLTGSEIKNSLIQRIVRPKFHRELSAALEQIFHTKSSRPVEITCEISLRSGYTTSEFVIKLQKLKSSEQDNLAVAVFTPKASAEYHELLKTKTIYELVVEQTLSGFWDWNIQENTQKNSPGYRKIFGYEDHELPDSAENYKKMIFPEDLEMVLKNYDDHVRSRGMIPYCNEVRYRHKNGSTVWVICSGKIVEWDDVGGPVRMIGCHIDITKEKEAEAQALGYSGQIPHSLPDLVFHQDIDGTYMDYYALDKGLLVVSPEQFLGKKPHEILPSHIAELHTDSIRKTIETQSLQQCEYELHIDGKRKFFEMRMVPFSKDQVISLVRDVSGKKSS